MQHIGTPYPVIDLSFEYEGQEVHPKQVTQTDQLQPPAQPFGQADIGLPMLVLPGEQVGEYQSCRKEEDRCRDPTHERPAVIQPVRFVAEDRIEHGIHQVALQHHQDGKGPHYIQEKDARMRICMVQCS